MSEQTELQEIITDRADSLIYDLERDSPELTKGAKIEIQLHLIELARDIGSWAVDEMKRSL